MLSLLIFIPSLRVGGAERVFVKVANGLAERGHRVRMVVTNAKGASKKNLSENVELIDLECSGVLEAFLPLINVLRKDPPDIVISAMTHTNFVAIACARLARQGIFVIVSERTSLALQPARIADKFARFLMPLVYRLADAIVVPAENMLEMLVKYTKMRRNRFFVISNPVTIPSAGQQPTAPHPWATPSEREKFPLLVSVGRLVAEKNLETLLAACFSAAERTDFRLAIVGEGPEREMLEERIAASKHSSRIMLFGHSDSPEAWYANSDLFVLSSKYEGMPNVLLEAMSWNLPVISTDCMTGPREILQDGKWGTLVPVQDKSKLGHAIAEALIKPINVKTVERALDFSDDAIIHSWEELFKQISHRIDLKGQLNDA